VSNPGAAVINLAARQARRAASRGRRAFKLSIEGIKDGWHAVRQTVEGIRDAGVNAAKDVFRRVRRPLRAASRHRSQMREQQQFYRTEWSVEHELEGLVTGGRRLVVGPWLSEVGFEALYWLPFLHWVKTAFQVSPDRVVAVSRGGVAEWYEGVAGQYVEIWDHVDPAAFARRNAERGATKHFEASDLDREILEHVARQIGTREFDVIHPGLMYRLFTLYWSGQRAMGFVDAHTRFTRVRAQRVIDPALLPSEYVAVKFYAAQSLPDTSLIRAQLRSMVASMAQEIPVVLLDTGLVLEDDHADYGFDGSAHIISARPWMTPQNNLGVQTQIAAGAKAFVGTCGSLTWLVPRLGVDTSAVFVDPKWLHAHLPVAMRAAHKLDAGRFAAADLRALDPWKLAAGRLEERA
jgi:hypothetical protein